MLPLFDTIIKQQHEFLILMQEEILSFVTDFPNSLSVGKAYAISELKMMLILLFQKSIQAWLLVEGMHLYLMLFILCSVLACLIPNSIIWSFLLGRDSVYVNSPSGWASYSGSTLFVCLLFLHYFWNLCRTSIHGSINQVFFELDKAVLLYSLLTCGSQFRYATLSIALEEFSIGCFGVRCCLIYQWSHVWMADYRMHVCWNGHMLMAII